MSGCRDRIRLPRHKWPDTWPSIEEPVVLLERNLHGHSFAGLPWERQFEKVLTENGWETALAGECLLVHGQQGLFLFA